MPHTENTVQSTIFTLHYGGEQISNHRMKLEDFILSLDGFDSLLKGIAQEIGIPQECLQLEIQPLDNGGIKAYVVAGIIGLTTFTLGHLGDHFFDDIHLYERSGLPELAYRLNQFLDRKKSVSNYKDFAELTAGLDMKATKIMMNKQIHQAADTFTRVLQQDVDVLEVTSDINDTKEIIEKNDWPQFRDPFIEVDLEERIYDEEKILRLDGPRYSGSEWIFYEKNNHGEWDKKRTFRAVVLDDFLLSFGRENSVNELENKDLYCTIRYREILKPGNKKKTIEKYVIGCRLTAKLF